MSVTETKIIGQTSNEVLTPDLKNLRTVKWITGTEVVQEGHRIISVKYKAAKEIIPFMALYLSLVEMIFSTGYLFLHSLPYPQFALGFVNSADRFAEGFLDSLANRLEWKPPEIVASNNQEEDVRSLSTVHEIPLIQYDCDDFSHYLSRSTSESESEVSVVSESWVMGHTDKYGKSYNRLEMKAKAEGRLRAAMFKRIKGQLKIMRKNSFSFSKGMAEYARQAIQPKVLPIYNVFKVMFDELEEKYGIVEQFQHIQKWTEKHYILAAPLTISVQLIFIPLKLFVDFVLPRKKSKKTRSMRSESLRRRAAAAAASNEFQHSRDIDSPEEPDADALAKLRKSLFKGGNDTNDDSALASSIDDCLTSDSNNGTCPTKDQVIYEPVNKENEPNTSDDIREEEKNGENEKSDDPSKNEPDVNNQMMKKQVSYEGSASTHTSSVDSSTDTENTTESKISAESEPELHKNKPTLRKSNLSYDGEKEEKARKQQRRISFTLT